MKLLYEYMVIFFNSSSTSGHFHPLQVENCDNNSRLVVDEDDNGKFRLERVILFVSIFQWRKMSWFNDISQFLSQIELLRPFIWFVA